MSVFSIEPQEHYFYEGNWSEATVNVFIRVLMEDMKTGDWDFNDDNVWSLQGAQDFVNAMMDKEFTWDEVLSLVTVLKKRSSVLKSILDVEGVQWNRRYNHIYVPAWDSIFGENEFAKAFYHKGDLMYDDLKALFGTEMVMPQEVICISSDRGSLPQPNNAHYPIVIPDSNHEEEEVDSPGIVGEKIPRSRLFGLSAKNECRTLVSLESRTGKIPKCFKPLSKPPTHMISSMQMETIKTPTKTAASSCESSSPFNLFDSPIGKK